MPKGKGNGPGRPRLYAKVRWIKFTDDQDETIAEMAEAEEVPFSEVVRRLVDAGLALSR